jgi:hypothetical protein
MSCLIISLPKLDVDSDNNYFLAFVAKAKIKLLIESHLVITVPMYTPP